MVSWGKSQILGEFYSMCGYGNVESFVTAMCLSEQKQLDAFVGYVRSKSIGNALKNMDWQAIADGYNGTSPSNAGYGVSVKQHYDDLTQ